MKLIRSLTALVVAMGFSIEATAQVSAVTGAVAPQECTVAQVQANSCGPKLNGLRIVIKDGATPSECGNAGDLGLQSFENVCRYSVALSAWLSDGSTQGLFLPNLPLDTDGDGANDFINCGDFDGDGTAEILDIVACQAQLTDNGGKFIYVLPGNYTAPAAAISGQNRALIELGSNTTLGCASPDTVTLNGAQWISAQVPTQINRAVIGNENISGDENITVRNCGIDGAFPSGWDWDSADVDTTGDTITLQDATDGDHGHATGAGPLRLTGTLPSPLLVATDYWVIRTDATKIQLATTYANAIATTAIDLTTIGSDGVDIGPDITASGLLQSGGMGTYFRGVDNLRVDGLTVKHTAHACIYHSDGIGFTIEGNYGDQCGGFGQQTGTILPGIYIFAQGGNRAADGLITGNRMDRTEAAAYNVRADDHSAGDRINALSFVSNSAWRGTTCVTIASAFDVSVDGLVCTETGSIILLNKAMTEYADQLGNAANSQGTIGLRFSNVSGFNTTSSMSDAIEIGDYNDGIELSNVSVNGHLNKNCMLIEQPSRGVVLDGVSLSGCGKTALIIQGAPGSPAEKLTIKNLFINGVDALDPLFGTEYEAIQFVAAGGADWLEMDGVSIKGFSITGIRFIGATNFARIKNVDAMCQAPGIFAGEYTEAQMLTKTCNEKNLHKVYLVTNADALEADWWDATTGAISAYAVCDDICTDDFNAGGPPQTSGTSDGLCDSDGVTVKWTSALPADHEVIRFTGALNNSVVDGITGLNCADSYVIEGTVAWSDVYLNRIRAVNDTTYLGSNGSTHNPSFGALDIPSGSSGLKFDMRTFVCDDIDSVAECVATDAISTGAGDFNEDDLASGSLYVDDTCADACTNGTMCIDDDATTNPVSVCESSAWVSVTSAAGGGDNVFIQGVAAVDPDFRDEGDIDVIRCTAAGVPDASCVAAEDVIFRYKSASLSNAIWPAGGVSDLDGIKVQITAQGNRGSIRMATQSETDTPTADFLGISPNTLDAKALSGGELAGTIGTPTVAATHSGSAHHTVFAPNASPSADHSSFISEVDAEINAAGGAGLQASGGVLSTKSDEQDFLFDSGVTTLACGASTKGKFVVHDTEPAQYCDGATTAVKHFVADADSAGLVTNFSNAADLDSAGQVANDSHTHAAGNITGTHAGTDLTADLEEEGEIGNSTITGNAANDQMIIGTGLNSAAWGALPAGGTDGCSGGVDKPTYTATTNTWGCGTDDDVPDAGDFAAAVDLDLNGEVANDSHNHNQSTLTGVLPLAGGTMTGALVADEQGVEFLESDDVVTCAAGDFWIRADASELVHKKCENGVETVMDTTGGTPAFSGITGATNTTAAMVVGTGASLVASGTGTVRATDLDADGVDAITEIAAALKSGTDAELITGTIATTDRGVKIDANDDLVESQFSPDTGAYATTKTECVYLHAEGSIQPAAETSEVVLVEGTNFPYKVVNFDDTADEIITWNYGLPNNIAGTTATVRISWLTLACTAATSDDVCWVWNGGGFQDDDAFKTGAFSGTETFVQDKCTTVGDVHTTAATTWTHGYDVASPKDTEASFSLQREQVADATCTGDNDDITGDTQFKLVQICYEGENIFSGEAG